MTRTYVQNNVRSRNLADIWSYVSLKIRNVRPEQETRLKRRAVLQPATYTQKSQSFSVDRPQSVSSTTFGQNTYEHRHSLNHHHIPLPLEPDFQISNHFHLSIHPSRPHHDAATFSSLIACTPNMIFMPFVWYSHNLGSYASPSLVIMGCTRGVDCVVELFANGDGGCQ